MPTATSDEQHRRRAAITELLQTHTITGQAELVMRLQALGFTATQSSVSRDLRDLGIGKLAGRYTLPVGSEVADTQLLKTSAEFVRKISPAGPNLLVIETAIGAAQRVALMLDRLHWPEVVGTLSGDDTIFVATTTLANQRRFRRRLENSLIKVSE